MGSLPREPDRPCLERGFTLVEMLIASLVFTVAIVSLMSMVLFALAARYSSRIDSAALKLSQQKLEELKAHSLEHAALSISGNPLDASGKIDFAAAADPQATVTKQLRAECHAQYYPEFRDAMEHYHFRIPQNHHCCHAQNRRLLPLVLNL